MSDSSPTEATWQPPDAGFPGPDDHNRPAKRGQKMRTVKSLLIAALVIGGATAFLIYRQSERVYLVNGLSRPYEVELNGDAYRLRPLEVQTIRLEMGPLTVKSLTPEVAIDAEGTLERGSFSGDLFVVNPDQTAAILWEQTIYSDLANPVDDSSDPRLLTNQLIHVFDGIDFAFMPFPDEIDLPRSNDTVKRERVSLLSRELDRFEVLASIASANGTEAAAEVLERRLDLQPPTADEIHLLSAFVGPERFLQRAQPFLDKRPIEIEWHRAYQETMARPEAIERYRDHLRDDPTNGDLQYLLGRIVEDSEEATELFSGATTADPPSGHAYAALAYDHLINGQYDDAHERIETALTMVQDPSLSFTYTRDEVYRALGKFETLLQDARIERRKSPDSTLATELEMYYLAMTGQIEQAQRCIQQHGRAIAKMASPEQRAAATRYLQTTLAMSLDQTDRFIQLCRDDQELGYASDVALLEGKLQEAFGILESLEYVSVQERLLVFTWATLEGKDDAAATQLSAIDQLIDDIDDAEQWESVRTWCERGEAPSAKEIRELELYPPDKRVAMLALGAAFPDRREAFWELARTMNYDRRWPYLSVRKLLGDG